MSEEVKELEKKIELISELNLWQRINKVMAAIEYLSKDDQIKFNTTNYRALSEEKVTSTVRPFIVKYGIDIIPVKQIHTRIGDLTTVDVTYELINKDNPSEKQITVSSGTGKDSQDKGVGKAMTYAYKYMLLRTFGIPTGEDPDKICNEELEQMQAKKQVTENQLKKMVELMSKKGLTPDKCKELMIENCNHKTSSKSLTMKEADKLINVFIALPDNK